MFMRNRLARKMAVEMREATCAGTQTSNHYSVAIGSHTIRPSDIKEAPYGSAYFLASLRSRRYSRAQGEKLEILPAQKLSILSFPAAG